MGHALDYDDFGGFGHPTVAIFPALLAIGEHAGATGRDLLEAYVVGCEVGLALQHTTKYKQMDKGFHSTAVIGRLACTAACAKLMKLDQQQTIMALGMAGSMASGLIHNAIARRSYLPGWRHRRPACPTGINRGRPDL